ncbi:glucosamine--fructose-6-phosphate aminotransferase (isomerizing) [Dysgonomonas sp. PFB1-18]|uniref:glutamine--fructose-6-phosphate transaminase (isomerizing) n=1 Tax=unclassified Dysgonomonas TaxID=2630389 RepID=UPI0024762957|nr:MULTISPECIES: glutamine--fructose-6-phosphate transaminase (isomerizing) [unclassified Dysgonomonas]MDH6307704.1 glucosamine--fructose-6-phosphate aminotransferase (isomerizing) [Dysgonomonas sp. PF1-14]MDH6337622.1 glucosamine--fructose-6-phosphate aminotransferase (isomerizing) [Dysgonomonas sp. PF1-16]MDH6378846.1 glucosamine--fructose-6-phosphate aminotransferase (isomerizing) [Dysgonomonas sp. PFB1-18]MDH6396481.1 glucosamine--fructose-6-phosphate aminotransferase (isomerizing) [Dysgono
MCGIVGYIGFREAYPILIKGLHRLEYRGYDSAGVAIINEEDKLSVYKAKGRVQDLEEYARDKDISGTIGIAHTRWATHGEPSNANAHPHYSQSESLALIHNGIIENYSVLKAQLENNGYKFQSSTDTEVLVQLIEYIKQINDCDLFTAVQIALNQVVGAYAIAVIEKGHPDQIIAARKSSPLVIGIGEGEFFIGSDASPIIEYTNKVIYLDDEEIAVIKRDEEPKVVTISNVEKTPEVKELEMNLSQLERGGYPHFMLKEIFEQPETLQSCMSGRINVEGTNVTLSGIIDHKDKFIKARRIIIIACGTSWHAGLIGEYLFEEFCRIPVEVEYASEFRYRNPVIQSDDIVIAISQSGETADSLAAIELARRAGAFVYGVCNVVGSSIPRNTDSGSYTHCGHEIGVASTKAFTAQVTVLTMMALAIGKEKGTIAEDRYLRVIKELQEIPAKIEKALLLNDKVKELSLIFTYAQNFIYLGRGYNYPIALEGALKLKEISYIHAEGYPAAEMKHGPIALIDNEMPVVTIATHSAIYEKVVSNIQEIKARKGRVIAIINEGDETMKALADHYIEIPATVECLDPLLTSIPLQLLAYHIAVNKNRDVDMPRNLAKSVTVE